MGAVMFLQLMIGLGGNVTTCMRHAAATNSQTDDGLAMSLQFSPNLARYFRRRSASFGELFDSRDTENSCRSAVINRPGRLLAAPVKAPLTWPNSVDIA